MARERVNAEYADLISNDEPRLDPDSLDPEMHYRFVSARRARLNRARGSQKYKPVLRSSGVRLLGDDGDDELVEADELISGETKADPREGTADDLIRDGDRVLMACPKALFNRRNKQSTLIKNARMESPVSSFKRKVGRAEQKLETSIRVSTSEREDSL